MLNNDPISLKWILGLAKAFHVPLGPGTIHLLPQSKVSCEETSWSKCTEDPQELLAFLLANPQATTRTYTAAIVYCACTLECNIRDIFTRTTYTPDMELSFANADLITLLAHTDVPAPILRSFPYRISSTPDIVQKPSPWSSCTCSPSRTFWVVAMMGWAVWILAVAVSFEMLCSA